MARAIPRWHDMGLVQVGLLQHSTPLLVEYSLSVPSTRKPNQHAHKNSSTRDPTSSPTGLAPSAMAIVFSGDSEVPLHVYQTVGMARFSLRHGWLCVRENLAARTSAHYRGIQSSASRSPQVQVIWKNSNDHHPRVSLPRRPSPLPSTDMPPTTAS